MNAVFAAEQSGVAIDAVLLGPTESAFLQQAAHITGGAGALSARVLGIWIRVLDQGLALRLGTSVTVFWQLLTHVTWKGLGSLI
jgi:Transcription factor Tfb4